MPRINQVPSCCGAAIIHDLGRGPFEFETDKSISYVEKKISTSTYTQYTIILDDYQRGRMGVRLEKLGFVRVSEMRNHSTKSILHTYMFSRKTDRNTDPKIASVDKAYPPAKVVEKEVIKYELTPDQKERLQKAAKRTKDALFVLEQEMATSR